MFKYDDAVLLARSISYDTGILEIDEMADTISCLFRDYIKPPSNMNALRKKCEENIERNRREHEEWIKTNS